MRRKTQARWASLTKRRIASVAIVRENRVMGVERNPRRDRTGSGRISLNMKISGQLLTRSHSELVGRATAHGDLAD
jgi:hypothetical protein